MTCREAEIGKLDKNNSCKHPVTGGISFPKDARSSYGRKNSRRQMERRKLFFIRPLIRTT